MSFDLVNFEIRTTSDIENFYYSIFETLGLYYSIGFLNEKVNLNNNIDHFDLNMNINNKMVNVQVGSHNYHFKIRGLPIHASNIPN